VAVVAAIVFTGGLILEAGLVAAEAAEVAAVAAETAAVVAETAEAAAVVAETAEAAVVVAETAEATTAVSSLAATTTAVATSPVTATVVTVAGTEAARGGQDIQAIATIVEAEAPAIANAIESEAPVVQQAVNQCTNVVYQGFDAAGIVRYVGITLRDPLVRFGEHLNSLTARANLTYSVVPGATNLSRIDARVWEQTLINQYGLDNLLNRINSIAPRFWDLYNIAPP